MADDFDTLQQAAEWFVRLQDEDCNEQTLTAWRRWLDSDDAHRKAWEQVEEIQASIGVITSQTHSEPAVNALRSHHQQSLNRRSLMRSFILLAGASSLGYLGWTHRLRPSLRLPLTADIQTATGEIREHSLPDGGRVWLNTASTLNVNFTPQQRLLEFIDGEVLIETGKDPQRRFLVNLHEGQLEALGTAFSIRRLSQGLRLQVHQGKVAIRTRHGHQRTVEAGQQTHFDATAINPVSPVASHAVSWTDRILLADDTRLQDLITELARYHQGYMGVAPAVADLKVTGTFPVDNIEQALSMLNHTLPVSVDRLSDWWITIEAR